MQADFDLDDDGHVHEIPQKPKAYKPGEGRPAGYSPRKAKEMGDRMDAGEDVDALAPESDEGQLSTTVKKARAQARKEVALAGLHELDLQVKSGQYLPRDAFREAAATLLAALAQGLRSLPDTMERKYGLQPEVLEDITVAIDESLSTVAEGLALFTEAKP